MSFEDPIPDIGLLDLVMKTIVEDPAHWNQNFYRTLVKDKVEMVGEVMTFPVTCHTAFCAAGWAVQLASETTPVWVDSFFLMANEFDNPCHVLCDGRISAERRAERLLGLTYQQAERLFDANNNLEALKELVEEIKEEAS